ncbi:MAG: sodium-dependent bicarbonate transport family permease [Hyphomicrobiales bacterium]|nr:sodium-dependent bicarbonate transport family permease [Hyphomicrobiales bacterium]
MAGLLDLAAQNLVSPMVLFFALGLVAALARSDLALPEAAARAIALYLMLAIGFKGGVGVAEHGFGLDLFAALAAGAALSALIPFLAFALLQATTPLSRTDAAAVAAHYGSISIVTFVAATQALTVAGLDYEGYLVAVAAIMETPAIVAAMWLARRGGGSVETSPALFREIVLNGAVVVLVGAFVIGWITGKEGMATISAFIVSPFKGVLCLFLLDMGVLAGRGLRDARSQLGLPVVAFALYMPLISAALAAPLALAVGLSPGGTAILMTLSASASYIAVPAAMRLALPEASPSIYLTLSLGVTFPFNLTIGIPLYIAAATLMLGSP